MKPTIRINSPEMEDVLARLEKLEQFEREIRTSNMLLYFAEVMDYNFIIAAPDVETAIQIVQGHRKNNNIEFLGRATIEYDKPQVVKMWAAWNWDSRDDIEIEKDGK